MRIALNCQATCTPVLGLLLVLAGPLATSISPAYAQTDGPAPNLQAESSVRVRLGIDDAGSYFMVKHPEIERWAHEPYVRALRDLGATLSVTHVWPVTNRGAENLAATAAAFARIDAAMRESGIDYVLNTEYSNWIKTLHLEPGKNEFSHTDGTHRWDLRMSLLAPCLEEGPSPRRFLGVMYDEAAHMQLTSHQFATHPDGKALDAPHLADTTGLSIEEAYDALTSAAERLRTQGHEGRVPLIDEQVWPDLFHVYARAGWVISPKLLKENLGSVVMSVALGAALQYSDRGAILWATPDLWFVDRYPGHSPAALRSALLMGYWLGAEALYVENLDWPDATRRHPEAEPGSLIAWQDPHTYHITKHGKVVQTFFKEYVPVHPRPIHWRDYRPQVAIIRLPDGAWGQRGTNLRDRLLGNPSHPMDDVSAEWLKVWPLLTHGVARDGAISLNNLKVYPEGLDDFFVPIDSVAVFDHKVTGAVLESVECFIVCGHALSRATFDAVAGHVAAGRRVCVIARRLYEQHAHGDLPGRWVIVDTFDDPAVAQALGPFLGPPCEARFRFKGHTVVFKKATERDAVDVSVTARHEAP